MRVYETTFIVDGKLPESEVDKLAEKFSQIITGNKGEIIKIEKLGKRMLAYQIGSTREGYYVYIETKMPEDIVKELERNYRINDAVIRYLTVQKITVKPPKPRKKKIAASAPSAAPVAAKEEPKKA